VSFRHLTSGERRRLQAGILSGPEAAMVSARAEAKESPSILEQIVGGVRLAAKAVAGIYTGGASTPLITALEQGIGSTPEAQLGLTGKVTPGGASMGLFDTTNGAPSDSSMGGQDWLGSIARIFETGAGIASSFGFPRSPLTLPGAGGLRELPPAGTTQIGFTPPTASGAAFYRRTLLHRVSMRIGHRVSLRDIVRLVRQLGISATAAGLGESETDIGGLFFFAVTRHRRRRGISARDISRARSTIRRMTGFMHMLQRGLPHRRALAPHGHRVVSFRRRAA